MLKIPESELAALRRHGEETYPNECCGALLGTFTSTGAPRAADARLVVRAVRCTNTNAERGHDRYVIDPRELVRLQRQSREEGLDILGFYHSHPDWPARWSQTDLAEAHWLGCSYVITRTERDCAKETNSFFLAGSTEEEKHFQDEALEIVPAPVAVGKT